MPMRSFTHWNRWSRYALLLALVIAVVHGWTIGGTFLSDDYDWVTTSERNLAAGRWWAPLTEPSGGNFYRPLQMLTFTFDVAVAGRTPAWFHIDQLLLFFALCLGVAWLVEVTLRRRPLAWTAGLIMAVYPAHHEVVTWLAGRADILAALFVTISAALAVEYARQGGRWRLTWLLLTSLLALLGKESALVLPAVHGLVLLIARWVEPGLKWKKLAWALVPAVAALAAILVIRGFVLTDAIGGYRLGGQARGLNITKQDLSAPLTSASMLVNVSYLRHVAGDNIFVKFGLEHYFQLRLALPVTIGFAALGLLVWRGWRRWAPAVTFAVVWVGITFVPTLGLSYAIGANLEGSRLFFLPSIGYSLLWAILLWLIFSSSRRGWLAPAAVTVFLLAFSGLSIFNGQPWALTSRTVKDVRQKLLEHRAELIPSTVTDVLVLDLPSKSFGAYGFFGKHIVRAVLREAAGRNIGVYIAGAERYTDSPFCAPTTERSVAIIRWQSAAGQWSRDLVKEAAIAAAQPAPAVTWSTTKNPWSTISLTPSGLSDSSTYALTNGQSGLLLSGLPSIAGAQYRALDVGLTATDTAGVFGSRRASLAWSSDNRFTSARQISFTIPSDSLSYSIPLCQYAAWVLADNIQALRLRPQQSGVFRPTAITLQPK